MLRNKLKKIFFLVFAGILTIAPAALAAGILPTESGAKNCTSPNGCGNYSLLDILSVAINVANWILGVVGAVALLFFVYGGFVFILSAGSEEKVKEGKQILINAIIGLAIVFASYLIIRFVSQLLGAGVTNGLQINIPASKV